MLDPQAFKAVIKNTPLVSIDLCMVCNDLILLGKRNNEPLKGQLFTPGGRIFKNESWQSALQRIALDELGLPLNECAHFQLMGVWDHFYPNSAGDEKLSTHYVNLPHFAIYESKPAILSDAQHQTKDWFNLDKIGSDENFHEYVRNYAVYLKNN